MPPSKAGRRSDQGPGLVAPQVAEVEGRGEAVEEGGGVLLLLGEGPQADARGEDRADILARLHRPAQLAQERRILRPELDQLLDLVAQQEQPQTPRPQPPPQAPERDEEIVGLDRGELDAMGGEAILGVEQRVAEVAVELPGVGDALEVPEDRQVAPLRRQVLELL